MDRSKDFLDEIIEKGKALDPDFEKKVNEALERRIRRRMPRPPPPDDFDIPVD